MMMNAAAGKLTRSMAIEAKYRIAIFRRPPLAGRETGEVLWVVTNAASKQKPTRTDRTPPRIVHKPAACNASQRKISQRSKMLVPMIRGANPQTIAARYKSTGTSPRGISPCRKFGCDPLGSGVGMSLMVADRHFACQLLSPPWLVTYGVLIC